MEAVPKIEGHATFYTHLKSGRVDKARIIGLDGDRFVEKILFSRQFFEAPIITSRICGICPVIHSITSTKAMEVAVGIEASPQTNKLRRLMLCGQMIQSHSLHLYLLVLPDFVGVDSSFELQKEHPELFKKAIELKKYADLIVEIIGGRAVHPVSNVVGGFKKYPSDNNLKEIIKESEIIENLAKDTINLFASFKYPEVEREIIYSSLFNSNTYSYYDGLIKNTHGDKSEAKDYSKYIYEEIVPYNKAKFATLKGREVVVGAMARVNLQKKSLHNEVLKIAKQNKIKLNFKNPFDNIIAQALETLHFVIESRQIAESLIGNIKKEGLKKPKKFGQGAACCEAPRGTLFHYYKVDDRGRIEKCNIITPTVHNLPSLELDMKKLSPLLKNRKKSERDHLIEMLIRAFDPCITCATH